MVDERISARERTRSRQDSKSYFSTGVMSQRAFGDSQCENMLFLQEKKEL